MVEYVTVFAIGGLMYGLLELIWRSWTHYTMLICGGFCFTLMYIISRAELSLAKKCVVSAAVITTVEFATGCVVNLWLGLHVWDYSAQRLDLMGQICPRFTLLWLLLSVPGLWLCGKIRRMFDAIGGEQIDNQ